MNKNPFILAPIAFIVTLSVIYFFTSRGSATKEWVLELNNPTELSADNEVAYTLDRVNGAKKDLTFRCEPKSGEGYFSLNSESLTWRSSHCQDMVGAVQEVIDGKIPSAVVKVKKIDHKVFYQVQRNQSL